MKKFGLVWLVENDSSSATLIKYRIKKSSFCEELVVYNDSQQALDCLQQAFIAGNLLPVIIFLDIYMPFFDGWQFLNELMQQPYNSAISIYIISSSIETGNVIRSKEYEQVKGYLLKPVTLNDLYKILSSMVS